MARTVTQKYMFTIMGFMIFAGAVAQVVVLHIIESVKEFIVENIGEKKLLSFQSFIISLKL